MIPKYKTLFLTFSIVRYNGDRYFFSVLFSNSEYLLNILILDSSVIAVDSDISYKNNILAFLAATVILKSLSYLILYNRCYSIFYF